MAMSEVPDRGNPNFFTLFNGSHVAQLAGSSSTSNVFMLTSMNTVQFLGDCTAGADGRMWVLPKECRPKNPVRFMCPIEPTGDVPGTSYEVVVDVTAESKAVSGSMEVAGMPNVKKSVIKVPDTPGSTFAVVTVMPDGTISGEPEVLHYTNGHMFSISDNWYLEG